MKFLIQKDFPTQKENKEILDIINCYPYETIDIKPYLDGKILNFDDKNYIPYCSTWIFDKLLELDMVGLNYDPNTANYETFISNRDDMLNNSVYNIVDAIEYLSSQPKTGLWFCKPNQGLKTFTRSVETPQEWIEVLQDRLNCKSQGSYKLESDFMLVLGKPKVIYSEYRWFIVNRKIISGSMYKKNGELYSEEILDRDITKEAQSYADKWLPNNNCVMDLALTSEGLKVVEFNVINSSGPYKCNMYKVFKALWEYYENR